MTFKLIDIVVTGRHKHAILLRRIIGQVEAVLEERHGSFVQLHPVSIRVFVDAHPTDSAEDIDTAILIKASEIVMRVKSRLEASTTLQAAE